MINEALFKKIEDLKMEKINKIIIETENDYCYTIERDNTFLKFRIEKYQKEEFKSRIFFMYDDFYKLFEFFNINNYTIKCE